MLDLSANDISKAGCQRIRQIMGEVGSGSVTVRLHDNEDSDEEEEDGDGGSSSGDGGDGSDAESDISGMSGRLGVEDGDVAAAAAVAVPKVLDVRGPRGALTGDKAAELCAAILRYAARRMRRDGPRLDRGARV